MSIRETVQRLLGGDDRHDDRDENEQEQQGPPSHVCQSCGEEYYTDPDMDIQTCRGCGGVKVEPATSAH